jgi:hypothetical protein
MSGRKFPVPSGDTLPGELSHARPWVGFRAKSPTSGCVFGPGGMPLVEDEQPAHPFSSSVRGYLEVAGGFDPGVLEKEFYSSLIVDLAFKSGPHILCCAT